ncbi:hypothetical protein AX15_001840 [Amanita polypyramis BW_CC]|nr:hypothetical protein AX15_001840 [Amanita polypyramis BW_CC]
MAPKQLPPEVWSQVFDNILAPPLLLSLAQVSRHFHLIAIRSLHRNLIYTHPFSFLAHHHALFTQLDSLLPLSLLLGISYLNTAVFSLTDDPSLAQVEADGSLTYPQAYLYPDHNDNSNSNSNSNNNDSYTLGTASPLPRPRQYYASDSLYDLIASRVSQFTMLTELIFYNAHLPPLVYTLLKSFPLLENLFFYDCFLPPKTKDLTSLDELPTAPIKRLALWNVRNDVNHVPFSPASIQYALRLVTIPTIRVLHVDWTGESAVFLNSLCKGSIPPVTDLAVRMPAQYAWPNDSTTARTRLIDPLVLFLTTLPTVTRLSVTNRLPSFSLPPHALPHLSTYAGPHTSVQSIAFYRNLLHVEFRDEDRRSLDVISLLPKLKESAPGLLSLSLPLKKWDEEIMYPTTGFFPHLKRLKIVYEEGYPSEYSILSLGARFLVNLPHLHTFQLYNSLHGSNYTPCAHADCTDKSLTHSNHSCTNTRLHFYAAPYTYSGQPTCTIFEEMAFPPSETLTRVHRLTKVQTQLMPPMHWHEWGQPGGQGQGHVHGHYHGCGACARNGAQGQGRGHGRGGGGENTVAETEWGSLGPQAGTWDEVRGYLAAWRRYCKQLKKVQFVKGFMWRRLDEDMPWVEAKVEAVEERMYGGG